MVRINSSGAMRDTDNGKFDYYGFMHPLNDYSFAKYMHKHRLMSDGTKRDANGWWGGFGLEVCIQSLARHMEDLKLLYAGYYVYEYRNKNTAERIVKKEKFKKIPKNYFEITIEDCCNSIRFNVEAFKLEILKKQYI